MNAAEALNQAVDELKQLTEHLHAQLGLGIALDGTTDEIAEARGRVDGAWRAEQAVRALRHKILVDDLRSRS